MKISVKSINRCESVIQTNYDIVKAHGGEIKVESKGECGNGVYYSKYLLSESLIIRIKRLHGIKK